jgi:hypothetical protein
MQSSSLAGLASNQAFTYRVPNKEVVEELEVPRKNLQHKRFNIRDTLSRSMVENWQDSKQ